MGDDREDGRGRADHGQEAHGLGDPGEQRGDHDRRALVDVGRVGVHRNRCHAEAQARHHEDQRDQAELGLRKVVHLLDKEGNRLQIADTRGTVEEGQAVEEQAGGEDAEEEILGRGLLARGVAPGEIEEQVGRDAHQLQPDEEEHQLVGGGHEQGAGVHNQ